jgi:perosamine synthetase
VIRLAVPYTDDDELREVAGVLASGYLTQGPKVAEFEGLLAAFVGSRYAFAMSSCTTALHLALVASDIGPGDEVLVPDFTFPATANVVVQTGARPVLVDVDEVTFAIDPADMEARIGPCTRAVLPVHPFGLSADMAAVTAIADAHALTVIEDAACALGATCGGRACGTMGALGCFSFHPRKSITTGEGGMIVTDDDVLAARIGLLRTHGGVRDELYLRFEDAGFNYRMSDLQAAVGVAQMRKLAFVLERRRALAARLDAVLASLAGVSTPTAPPGRPHTYQSYVVRLAPGIDRDAVIVALRARGIEATLGTYALHAQPYFARTQGHTPGDLTRSYAAFRQSLTLPLYPQMDETDPARIAGALSDAIAEVG